MAIAGSALLILVMAFATACDAHAQPTSSLQFVRLKPADPELRRLIVDGYGRSETFRTVADEIQQANAVVIVQFGQCGNGRFRSCVTNVDGDARQRNVRVKINTRTTDDRLIATIAHELWHVVEILSDAEAMDADRTLALYRRIGEGQCRKGLSDACETKAALDTEKKVLEELTAGQTLRAPQRQ